MRNQGNPVQTYSELRPGPICSTITTLVRRIQERFPGSGLGRVADELLRVAEENQRVAGQLQHPLWQVRAFTALAVAMLIALVLWAVLELMQMAAGRIGGVAELLQATDAATNQLILLSLAVLFLTSLETRIKRRTALRMLHRLRSIAHVVDMHQLTKDPEHVLRPVATTASSPVRTLTHAQLARYLDYCSELLALTSKLAALHAQHLHDPVVLDAVNDIETLTSDLSRKIWQKITILDMAAAHVLPNGGAAGGDFTLGPAKASAQIAPAHRETAAPGANFTIP